MKAPGSSGASARKRRVVVVVADLVVAEVVVAEPRVDARNSSAPGGRVDQGCDAGVYVVGGDGGDELSSQPIMGATATMLKIVTTNHRPMNSSASECTAKLRRG
jgi:hypothetical protein